MMTKNVKRKFTAFLAVIFTMALFLAVPISARPLQGDNIDNRDDAADIQANIDKNREEQRKREKKIEELNKEISKNKQDVNAAKNLREEYESYAKAIEADINLQLELIGQQEEEIEIKRFEIAVKEEEFAENEELLKEIIGAIYKTNTANPVSTLMAVDSFSDFLIVYDNSQRISKNYTEKLEEIVSQKEELEELKTNLESKLIELEAKREELEKDLERYQQLIKEQKAKESEAMHALQLSQEEKDKAYKEYKDFEQKLENLFQQLEKSKHEFTGGDLAWPVPSHTGASYVTSHFGNRTLFGRTSFHRGVDIGGANGKSISGQSIVAALDGQVILVDTSNASTGYGYYMIIDHGGGVRTLYAHCSSIGVSQGAWVTKGSYIGAVGNTGNSTGPHLHFELRLNNSEAVNPYPYLTGASNLG